jgi:hypothetical protein
MEKFMASISRYQNLLGEGCVLSIIMMILEASFSIFFE